MREVGEVVSQFKRFLICRTALRDRTLLGETVYSEKGERVGVVIDIFGPVKKPYLKILKRDGENVHTLYIK